MHKFKILTLFIFIFSAKSFAQKDSIPIFKGAIKANKEKQYQNLVNNSINKNLNIPLNADTEERWENAFWVMEVLQYRSVWVDSRIRSAFDSIDIRSDEFQRSLLELVYGNYPKEYKAVITTLLKHTANEKIFAMCAEYLLQADSSDKIRKSIKQQINSSTKISSDPNAGKVIYLLSQRLGNIKKPDIKTIVKQLSLKNYLPKNVIVYSFQRKNRNYPGLAIVRDTAGHLVIEKDGRIFSVPQLARSKSALPYYLTNGNTPQGIYRMFGFDTSQSSYIGPTTNIQLTMPLETSLQHFFNDSTIVDSIWTIGWYKKILPVKLKNTEALYESYYASEVGRTEIIAHGTSIDPAYYKAKTFYPQTPTEGCLCTKEIWSELNGKRLESDQQKLADAVKLAGGPNGYYIVIDIDDKQKPVTVDEIIML